MRLRTPMEACATNSTTHQSVRAAPEHGDRLRFVNTVLGAAGTQWINGGTGDDVLTGGASFDRFSFGAGSTRS